MSVEDRERTGLLFRMNIDPLRGGLLRAQYAEKENDLNAWCFSWFDTSPLPRYRLATPPLCPGHCGTGGKNRDERVTASSRLVY